MHQSLAATPLPRVHELCQRAVKESNGQGRQAQQKAKEEDEDGQL